MSVNTELQAQLKGMMNKARRSLKAAHHHLADSMVEVIHHHLRESEFV